MSRARLLRFERLEDRSLLAGVLVDLINSADTGRSNQDNITNKMPEVGDVVFYFPEFAGIGRFFLPSTANAYVNGVGSDTHAGVTSSMTTSNLNDVQGTALAHLWEGENLISVTTEYFDLDTSVSIEIGTGAMISVGETTGEIILEGNLTIWIDTTDPTGDGHLHPDSDTGVVGSSGTAADRITADSTPTFFGTAEGNSLVTVGILDPATGTRLAGAAVTEPRDATVQGAWRVDTQLPLSDGEYYANFTFEDVAGNTFTDLSFIDERWFLVDTQGPRVTGVEVNSPGNPYDLFAPDPADGPTPLVQSLIVQLADANLRTDRFLYDAVFAATATNVGHYQVVGDASGFIPIEAVTYTPLIVAAGQPATGYVTIHFQNPLPDDRFTLRIADSLVDVAGNALDGESNAAAAGTPQLPSGNGQSGGGFVARFTIDSRAEIGAWGGGRMHLDINGNFVFDPHNWDASNRDMWLTRGAANDLVFAGDFDGSGFDQVAAYRKTSSGIKWLIPDDRLATQSVYASKGPKGIPVAGEFNGNPADGDEIGLFAGKRWYFDTSNHKDFQLDRSVPSKVAGLPIVGNFDGVGGDDLGLYNPKTNKFLLSADSLGGGITNGRITSGFGIGSGFPFNGVQERPVAGDIDGDGLDDIAIYRGLQSRDASSAWSFFVSGGRSLLGRVQQGFLSFVPRPFGSDLFTWFGNKFQQPFIGNFDPPVARPPVNSSSSLRPNLLPPEPLTAMTRDSVSGAGERTLVASSQASIDDLLASMESLQTLINASRAKPATKAEPATDAQSDDANLPDDVLAAGAEEGIGVGI